MCQDVNIKSRNVIFTHFLDNLQCLPCKSNISHITLKPAQLVEQYKYQIPEILHFPTNLS